jgi:hypothetical protein
MKYETPEVTALTPAIDAIQSTPASKGSQNPDSPASGQDTTTAYEDWE